MKTAELLDKALQMLIETRSTLPCADMSNDEEFCRDFCKPWFDGPQKECWLHYIEWTEENS